MPPQNQGRMHPQMNQNYQQHYMNTPQQGPDSQSHMAQPSPYAQSPYNQQHSVGSSFNVNAPPSNPPPIQPNTPQQQLNIPQRADGRFTSPQSITQKSPANVMSNQVRIEIFKLIHIHPLANVSAASSTSVYQSTNA
jgi:hypothetical protein